MNIGALFQLFNSPLGKRIYCFVMACIDKPLEALDQLNTFLSNMCLSFGIPENHIRLMVLKYQGSDISIVVMVFNQSQNIWLSQPLQIRDLLSDKSQMHTKLAILKETILSLYQSTTYKTLPDADTTKSND
jgi:hypothetical protein